MLGLVLRLSIGCLIVFSVFAGILRVVGFDAQYYDKLRADLSPTEVCPAPCFMYIRPLDTGVSEALLILESHHWVDHTTIAVADVQMQIRHTRWEWDESKPDYLGDYGEVNFNSRNVGTMLIPTSLHFGELWLAFGAPSSARVDANAHLASFESVGFSARMPRRCAGNYWWETVDLQYPARTPRESGYDWGAMKSESCAYE